MHHIDEIAAACPERMEAMVFGVADYAASLQSHTTSIGGSTSAYSVRTEEGAEHWGDQWHYPLARIAVACRAHGLRPIDGPYGDFGDPEGYRTAARRAAVLGYEGKWAIHPSQVALANEVFTPDAAAAEKTRRIVAAMAEAAREGRGAVSLDGRLIDAASLRMAETLLHKLEQIEARERRAGAGGGGMTAAAAAPIRERRALRRAAARCSGWSGRASRPQRGPAPAPARPRSTSRCGAARAALHATCAELLPGYAEATREPWRQALLTAGCLDRARAAGAPRRRRAADRARTSSSRPTSSARSGSPAAAACSRRAPRAATASGCARRATSCRPSPPGVSRERRDEVLAALRANTAWRAHRAARALAV